MDSRGAECCIPIEQRYANAITMPYDRRRGRHLGGSGASGYDYPLEQLKARCPIACG